jgi:hypothetical protein
MERKIGRRIIENVVLAPLRFEQNRKSRIATDVDAVYRVHLDGNIERHRGLSKKLAANTARKRSSLF